MSSDDPTRRPNAVVPVAILLGAALIAAAIYFRPAAPSVTTAGEPEPAPLAQEEAAREERGEPPGHEEPPSDDREPPPEPPPAPEPPERVHTDGMFRTLWDPHVPRVAADCRAREELGTKDDTRFLEIPMTLEIAAEGRVTGATPATTARDVGHDGSYRATTREASASLRRCYAEAVRRLVHFPPATGASRLEVAVRLLATLAP